MLRKWKEFEVKTKEKDNNADYLTEDGFDFDNYYKGKTVNKDIVEFFREKNKSQNC